MAFLDGHEGPADGESVLDRNGIALNISEACPMFELSHTSWKASLSYLRQVFLLALVVSALANLQRPAPEIEFQIDGVSLGMSEAEVRMLWSNCRDSRGEHGEFQLCRESESTSAMATFSPDGKAVCVSGLHLTTSQGTPVLPDKRFGTLEGFGEPYHRSWLSTKQMGPYRRVVRRKGDYVFEFIGLDSAKLPAEWVQENPKLEEFFKVRVYRRSESEL